MYVNKVEQLLCNYFQYKCTTLYAEIQSGQAEDCDDYTNGLNQLWSPTSVKSHQHLYADATVPDIPLLIPSEEGQRLTSSYR